ncbi:hypothetical protein D0Y65_021841 [Glycine soja]|uniref:Replication protein A 70 kDa DNA-binding subunit B/D first OB fold domain-containing protein n=1 Tax=Glycine soja TaxID=3848 RepID=A0A445JL51_GLYSO|nr:hypothetical protein D0Y65_021841 [Glycine soja]
MARIPDKINSIDGSKEALKLAVRITDLWFVGTPNKSKQAKMVIVDFEGDQIHVVCKADQLKCWKANLKENSTYVMHNFKVVKNDGQFRVCEHEYKLVFIGVTVVKEADLHQLPFKEFRFVEFGNVVGGNFVAGLLVDIIGVVDQQFSPLLYIFGYCQFILSWILFAMLDDGYLYLILMNGEVLSCTLWENYCMQFLAYLNECGNDGSIVIILTHARIKDAQEFRERYFGFPLHSVPVKLDVVCVMVGTISKIVMDSHSWCYPACIQCHRKTDIETGPFTCECGKDNDQPVLR